MNILDVNALARRCAAPRLNRSALVIGASLAGLLAARVLSENFDEVILLERDALPAADGHRKATPHTRHAHGLLARGRQVLEELFPGIVDEWVAAGASVGDLHGAIAFSAGTMRFADGHAGIDAVAVGRVVIEGSVRRRVLALPNVFAATGVDVQGLRADPARSRIIGASLQPLRDAGAGPLELAADLIVDASGRGSRLPNWLVALGFEAPAEERVKVDLRYATAYLGREPSQAPGREAVLCAATAESPLPGVMLAQEGRRWVVTLGGYGPDMPPLKRAGFVARAQRMAPEIAVTVRDGCFQGDPIGYRFPHSQRRRFERLRRFPAGLLAIGDALCSFNPIYGQGMSVAACEALALRACLAAAHDDLASRYFRAAARIVDVAWSTAVGADLAIPSVEGDRPLGVRIVNAYISRVFRAARHDAQVAQAFLRVAHLLAEPASLMRPSMLARVARALWRQRGVAARAADGAQAGLVQTARR